jgi:hypothetical protein
VYGVAQDAPAGMALLSFKGRDRNRIPVAAKIALLTAVAMPVVQISLPMVVRIEEDVPYPISPNRA